MLACVLLQPAIAVLLPSRAPCELSYMALAMELDPSACSSLLTLSGAVPAFNARVCDVATSHRRAVAVTGTKLSYMALAMELEQSACSSLLTLFRAAHAGPQPMPFRLVRGCIAMAFNARVRAVASSHRCAVTVKGTELSHMASAKQLEPISFHCLRPCCCI